CAGLEKGPDTAADEGTPPRRLGDARQDLEQRALPRTVPAHDADDITLADLERQVVERPDPGRLGAVSTPEGRPQQLPDPVAQHAIRLACTEPIALRQPLGHDGGSGRHRPCHTTSANVRSI